VVSTSIVKCSEVEQVLGTGCLSLLEDKHHMKLASFIFFWFCLVSLYIWLYVLWLRLNFVNYVFLIMFMYSYCYVCSVIGILFHCVALCIVCV